MGKLIRACVEHTCKHDTEDLTWINLLSITLKHLLRDVKLQDVLGTIACEFGMNNPMIGSGSKFDLAVSGLIELIQSDRSSKVAVFPNPVSMLTETLPTINRSDVVGSTFAVPVLKTVIKKLEAIDREESAQNRKRLAKGIAAIRTKLATRWSNRYLRAAAQDPIALSELTKMS